MGYTMNTTQNHLQVIKYDSGPTPPYPSHAFPHTIGVYNSMWVNSTNVYVVQKIFYTKREYTSHKIVMQCGSNFTQSAVQRCGITEERKYIHNLFKWPYRIQHIQINIPQSKYKVSRLRLYKMRVLKYHVLDVNPSEHFMYTLYSLMWIPQNILKWGGIVHESISGQPNTCV